ncbi:uncharacterized protein YeaO (DUF488 family) [Cytobacillus oceanisediminis]|jgi:uncharacterized protein YeaO (DUF488 family)|uniref:Uncharacterized protein YeaO (DUF488 family) n=1 Tax=Cytobacillus oceanisediminis TaxID=665099 RepID=A0A2V2ZN70_9BACI|nr:DUF488 family protein [Cytobacillus oceanisediminis]PWW25484.1 uncharacterized protein YeaO (DUF488 family) [Cytobacillus oceanisediminis]
MAAIFIKRIYDPFEEDDGSRVLIDRLWPRGIKKEDARLSAWEKDIAPSSELRKAFNHKPELFNEFREKYLIELRTQEDKIRKIEELASMSKVNKVTLLYAAKDPIHNHARVLCEELMRKVNQREGT